MGGFGAFWRIRGGLFLMRTYTVLLPVIPCFLSKRMTGLDIRAEVWERNKKYLLGVATAVIPAWFYQ